MTYQANQYNDCEYSQIDITDHSLPVVERTMFTSQAKYSYFWLSRMQTNDLEAQLLEPIAPAYMCKWCLLYVGIFGGLLLAVILVTLHMQGLL